MKNFTEIFFQALACTKTRKMDLWVIEWVTVGVNLDILHEQGDFTLTFTDLEVGDTLAKMRNRFFKKQNKGQNLTDEYVEAAVCG